MQTVQKQQTRKGKEPAGPIQTQLIEAENETVEDEHAIMRRQVDIVIAREMNKIIKNARRTKNRIAQ